MESWALTFITKYVPTYKQKIPVKVGSISTSILITIFYWLSWTHFTHLE